VTAELTFDVAIAKSNQLIEQVGSGEISAEDALPQLLTITQSMNGARGFFVALLTGDSKLSEDPPAPFYQAFKQNREIVYDLLAKNVVMSSATAYTHLMNQDPVSAEKSMSVARKTLTIMGNLNDSLMDDTMALMSEALEKQISEGDNTGDSELPQYVPFLRRWRYSKEQLDHVRNVLAQGIQP
jgi:hypothetical protein